MSTESSMAVVRWSPTPRPVVSYDTTLTPTQAQYAAFESLFAYYNRKLFDDTLPKAMLTFSRKTGARGYFTPDEWANTDSGEITSSITLNPDHLARSRRDVMGTLVHEMVHLWQHHYGAQKSRRAYHNAEWGTKMESLGLMPSATGQPSGKRTGQRMTHYVITGGEFERAFLVIPDEWYLPFIAGVPERSKKPKAKSSKTKFACPVCRMSAWGKPDLTIDCHKCDELMLAVR
jgi:hypothetical protein